MRLSIHNNYGLSDEIVQKFKEKFSYTRGKQLSIEFGLNLNEIRVLRDKFNLSKDIYVPVLSPNEVESFKLKFHSLSNKELMQRFNITRSQLDYMRKKLGLSKRPFKKVS